MFLETVEIDYQVEWVGIIQLKRTRYKIFNTNETYWLLCIEAHL